MNKPSNLATLTQLTARARERRSRRASSNSIACPSSPTVSTLPRNEALEASASSLTATSVNQDDPESFWLKRAVGWTWIPSATTLPTVKLTPPEIPPITDADPFGIPSTTVWTPLQSAFTPAPYYAPRLTVPQTYVLPTPASLPPHRNCNACQPDNVMAYRKACEDRAGMKAEDVLNMSVDEQRWVGLHGRVWCVEFGFCVCEEWRIWEKVNGRWVAPGEADEEAEEGVETESDEDEIKTPMQGLVALPIDSHLACDAGSSDEESSGFEVATHSMEVDSALPTALSSTTKSPGPRWMDLEDDDELPDLTDWT